MVDIDLGTASGLLAFTDDAMASLRPHRPLRRVSPRACISYIPLNEDLLKLWREDGLTVVFVTHSV